MEDILSTEFDPMVDQICGCGDEGLRLYRCTDTGCLGAPTQCKQCIIQAHRFSPFHWIQEWNGRFFERKDLSEIGLVFTLGHNGTTCPKAIKEDPGIRFTIIDTNGIHSTCLHFCFCFGELSRACQLT
jgi:hypothetical protein